MKETKIPRERRRSERSDFYRVMQFKPVKSPTGYSLGISRNLSYGGISFESQVVGIEPGEDLEFVLKYPQGNKVLSCIGRIVWKKTSDKFKTFAGIRFLDLNKNEKDNIMDMLSVKSDILPGVFPHDEPAVHSLKEKKVMDILNEEQEPQLVRSTDKEVCCDETGNRHELILGSHDVNDYAGKADAFNADLIQEKDKRRRRIGYRIVVSLLALTAVAAVVIVLINNNKKDNESPSVTTRELASPPAAAIKQTTPADVKAQIEKLDYSIQVGAWKNPDYAQEMLLKLKKYYAGVYMDKKNNFHLIKIKGISTQQQGAAIVQDINKRFGLKPILIKPDQ